MIHRTLAALFGVLILASAASAQAPRFRWQAGQTMTYRTEHNTLASYLMGDSKSETKTHVMSLKQWKVLNVDEAGTATLQMSLAALVFETTPPDGAPLVFDSRQPDKSDEQLRKQFGGFVGQPLAVLRLDVRGKILEVKEARSGFASAAKFESEPAFKMLLPVDAFNEGMTWDRAYQLTLEPPQGTGEKYDAVQHYACKSIANNQATVTLTTEVKNAPAAQEDQVPLWQMQPEGELLFDVQSGRLQKATLRIDKEAKVEGGSTHFQSTYVEQYVE